MNVGNRLKKIRENKNISIYKLSQDSEVSESHIRNLERGNKSATVETLEMLVKSLGLTMAEFFNEDDNVTYPSAQEKILLNYYRTLPEKTAQAVIMFCENMSENR